MRLQLGLQAAADLQAVFKRRVSSVRFELFIRGLLPEVRFADRARLAAVHEVLRHSIVVAIYRLSRLTLGEIQLLSGADLPQAYRHVRLHLGLLAAAALRAVLREHVSHVLAEVRAADREGLAQKDPLVVAHRERMLDLHKQLVFWTLPTDIILLQRTKRSRCKPQKDIEVNLDSL